MTKEQLHEIEIETVFFCFCSAEISRYTTLYADDKAVCCTREIANILKWTKYRTKKIINELVGRGWIERTSIGCPAVVSYGEYTELVCEAMPPKNGYAITKAGFQTDLWKKAYSKWEQSMREWAEGGRHETD